MTAVETRPNYKTTLNITLNDKEPGAFPQYGGRVAKEPGFLERWQQSDLYRRTLDRPAPQGTFVLHDGPPYSNGDIHLGHALNKVAKDITTRYKTMCGYSSPYVPGWDNHGMPIENAVAKKFREAKQAVSRVELRQACREYAKGWVATQSAQFQRLGVRGDWQHPYLTMDSRFEAKIVQVFGELADRGFIYRGLKPVLWCATCETALADAEVEYENHTSNSIYVRFPLLEDPNGVFAGASDGVAAEGYNPAVIIWTTTPWTIPANLAVAVHPDADYVVAGVDGNAYLVAEPLLESVLNAIRPGTDTQTGASSQTVDTVPVLRRLKGSDLAGLVFAHPLFGRPSPVVLADYVTMDAGTGIVHTAPGHGKEDFETGQKYGLETLNPVDASGRYTRQAGEYDGVAFEGLRVTTYGDKKGADAEANTVLIEALRKSGNLLSATKFSHSYPHCWRCHSPLVFRATVQWFMNIDHDGHREKCLAAIQSVNWVPRESINRINSMVGGRPDWCVSRQRSWGVGIPAFYCGECQEAVLTTESTARVVELVARENSDAWYVRTPEEILGADWVCPHCGGSVSHFTKETDVLDVWFDSGSTSRAVLDSGVWPELSYPADVYLEGGDQHRGWFNSSLMLGVATKEAAPYKTVVTNGWTLDEQGKAMHKSAGNVVNPLTLIGNPKIGADVVRWWVASSDFKEEARCGDKLLEQVGSMYQRVRNAMRFLLNNLYDFDPATDAIPDAQMEELDRWALARFDGLVRTSTEAYDTYEYHRVYQAVLVFCAEMSSFYMDVSKDRLYASAADSPERRSTQTAFAKLADGLARLLAPLLVFTAEEVWDYLKTPGKTESVHLADFPVPGPEEPNLLARWERILALRDAVNLAVEPIKAHAIKEAKEAGVAYKWPEPRVDVTMSPEEYAQLAPYTAQLPSLLMVSQVNLSVSATVGDVQTTYHVIVEQPEGDRCARCLLIKLDVGCDPAYPDVCARCAGVLHGLESM